MKSKSSYIMAGIVALAVVGWMFSDDLLQKYGGDTAEKIATADTRKIDSKPSGVTTQNFTVSAVRVSNQQVTRVVRASGVTNPKFEMTVSAKAAGQIINMNAVAGHEVKAGDVLLRLDKGTLVEQIDAAKANLEVTIRRREITERLAKKNFSAPLEQAERAADYALANANLRQLEEQLADTVIVAPVSGYLEILHVEKGERVRRDTAIATILGLDKLSVVVAVPQNEVGQIEIGTKVTVEIAGNGSRSATVSRIAAKSNPATRTFDVEIDLPNKDRKILAGMSVEATINAGTLPAFAMSPAHLSVGENGDLTAKTVVDGKAVLVPVEVVRSGAELVFVSGLPDNALLLTVGQGFVEDGAKVLYKLVSTS